MISRINIVGIISGHLKTLKSLNQNQNSNRIYFPDLLLFFLFPILLSGFLTYQKIDLLTQVSNLIAAVSILGGFLFNFLAIIYGAMDKLKKDIEETVVPDSNNTLKKIFIREIHSNISYCILLSIFSVTFLIIYSYSLPCSIFYQIISQILLFINYFLLIHFLLSLLMVLNRVYILLKKDI